jgi:acyl dehydratase
MSSRTGIGAGRVIHGLAELHEAVGQELCVSAWHDVTQDRVDAFAAATDDLNWMHVDPQRCARESPAGGTIAHGLYTLSLGPKFKYEIVAWEDIGIALNYGYNRVRFPAMLPVGSRVRMRLSLGAVKETGSGVEVTLNEVFEREGGDRPVCVAEFLLRFVTMPE